MDYVELCHLSHAWPSCSVRRSPDGDLVHHARRHFYWYHVNDGANDEHAGLSIDWHFSANSSNEKHQAHCAKN